MFRGLFGSQRAIQTFDGKYAFLSNTYQLRHPITEKVGPATLRYPTVAHAIYGMHLSCLTDKIRASKTHTNQLPRLDVINPSLLLGCLHQKFRNPELRERLVATGSARLQGATGLTRTLLEQVREEARLECSTTRNSNPSLGTVASISS